jgi:hypothetical protein
MIFLLSGLLSQGEIHFAGRGDFRRLESNGPDTLGEIANHAQFRCRQALSHPASLARLI